ncbi:MAG: response regulator [Candidatus Omnitrophica bacterium]|nr:response regulator [Candidatus Omnitrophota bacterium]
MPYTPVKRKSLPGWEPLRYHYRRPMVKLLVADDEQKICEILNTFFSERGYHVLMAHDGPSALACIREERPHIVFLDLRMPGLDGLDILRQAKAIDPSIKIIVVTAVEDDSVVQQAKLLGATDYVTKPFTLEYLKEDVLSKVSISLYEDLRAVNEELKESVERLKNVVHGIVAAFSAVVSKIDPHYTHQHVIRTVDYASKIIQKLREQGRSSEFGGASEEVLLAGVLLHDIGKIFTPKEILYKSGPLTDEELEIMRRHPVDGAEVLERIAGLKDMAKNVRYHHERYDGSGYPEGRKGQEIPIGARIASVVDAFDAMISNRPYRKAMPVQQALEELQRYRGSQFDPQVVDTLILLYQEGKLNVNHEDHHHDPTPPKSEPVY